MHSSVEKKAHKVPEEKDKTIETLLEKIMEKKLEVELVKNRALR